MQLSFPHIDKMYAFTAVDFETATAQYSSICQIGLVRIENGIITETVNQLIKPPKNIYSYQNINIHGIQSKDTSSAPTFDEYWDSIKHFFIHQHVVAHNLSFDGACLKKTLEFYQLQTPAFQGKCTYKIYKKGLAKLCIEHNIKLNHHDALSDALACAQLYMMHLEK